MFFFCPFLLSGILGHCAGKHVYTWRMHVCECVIILLSFHQLFKDVWINISHHMRKDFLMIM